MSDTGALVYVVDDDASAREGVAGLLRSAGLMTKTFASGEEFLAAPRPKMPSCLVLDVNLPGVSGLDLQRELAKSDVPVPIIFLTGHGDIPMTVRAVRAGAANFLTKPFDDEELLNAVRECIPCQGEDRSASYQKIGNMVGESAGFREVLRTVQLVAPTDATVLIEGETGTGKELVARAIHELSSRSKRPFITVNCAAIPATLLESELFGHEKGAFTGAIAQKAGRYELAHQATLFLDEIADIPLELQPKLLRVLQEQEFERLGGTRTIRVDVRVIAATNRNLAQMVDEGKFRSDLYYRLHVFPMAVPPLRERREDIPLLVHFFVNKHSRRMGKHIDRIPVETMQALSRWHWPGNVRELENVIERALILSQGTTLNVPLGELNGHSSPRTFDENIQTRQEGDLSIYKNWLSCRPFRFPASGEVVVKRSLIEERQRIEAALAKTRGRVSGPSGAAAKLGVPPSTLESRIRSMNIDKYQFKSSSSGNQDSTILDRFRGISGN